MNPTRPPLSRTLQAEIRRRAHARASALYPVFVADLTVEARRLLDAGTPVHQVLAELDALCARPAARAREDGGDA